MVRTHGNGQRPGPAPACPGAGRAAIGDDRSNVDVGSNGRGSPLWYVGASRSGRRGRRRTWTVGSSGRRVPGHAAVTGSAGGRRPGIPAKAGGRAAAGGGRLRVDFAELESAPAGGIVPVADDDLAALMYTGGTTGPAKGVMLWHRNLYYCSPGRAAGGWPAPARAHRAHRASGRSALTGRAGRSALTGRAGSAAGAPLTLAHRASAHARRSRPAGDPRIGVRGPFILVTRPCSMR
jgi:AMP-binding enzyme